MKFLLVSVLAMASATLTAAGGNDGSLTLDKSVIQKIDGSAQADGESNSKTSNNNFIDFCKGKQLTNGKQVKGGSCNPTPQGDIPSTGKMVSAKFQFPKNNDKVDAFKDFEVQIKIKNLQTGTFTNADNTYYAAPQQLSGGQIVGHSHIVIEKIDSIESTSLTNPSNFAFFKGLNDKAVNGILKATVDGGLPAGSYRLASINSSSNHQPVLMPVAQHGSVDDIVYFTVGGGGDNGGSGNGNDNGGSGSGDSGSGSGSSSGSGSGSGNSGTANNDAATSKRRCRAKKRSINTVPREGVVLGN